MTNRLNPHPIALGLILACGHAAHAQEYVVVDRQESTCPVPAFDPQGEGGERPRVLRPLGRSTASA